MKPSGQGAELPLLVRLSERLAVLHECTFQDRLVNDGPLPRRRPPGAVLRDRVLWLTIPLNLPSALHLLADSYQIVGVNQTHRPAH